MDKTKNDAEELAVRLRELWTQQGVSQQRQDEMLVTIAQKAQPGAQIGPFRL